MNTTLSMSGLALLRLLLKHSAQLPSIAGYINEFYAAATWAERIEPLHALTQILFPILDELKDAAAMDVSGLSYELLHVEAKTLGVNWVELIEKILPLVLQIWNLVRGGSNAGG